LANVRDSGDDERVWRILLWTGGVFAVLLLGWQIGDYVSDAAHPAMQKNDLASALASLLALAVVAVIAFARKRNATPVPERTAVRASKTGKAKKPAKRGAAPVRRKRRA